MGTVRRGTAVAANTHCAGATGEHGFNTETGPQADVVTVFFEVAVLAVIDGEQEFGRARDIHEAEYNAVLRACKASERRSRDARPIRALRSVGIYVVHGKIQSAINQVKFVLSF